MLTEILIGTVLVAMLANIGVQVWADRRRTEYLTEMHSITEKQQKSRDELLAAVDARVTEINLAHQCMHAMQERAQLQFRMEEHGLGHVLQQ